MTTRADMDRLIEQHIAAERAADSAAAVAVYSDDVVHDVVGWPTGPVSDRPPQRTSTTSCSPPSSPKR